MATTATDLLKITTIFQPGLDGKIYKNEQIKKAWDEVKRD